MITSFLQELSYQIRVYPVEKNSIHEAIFDVVGKATQAIINRPNKYTKKDYGLISIMLSRYMRSFTKRYYSESISYYDIYNSAARSYFLQELEKATDKTVTV